MSAALTRSAPVRAHRPASSSRAASPRAASPRARPRDRLVVDDKQAGAGLKAVWYGAEAGKVVGATRPGRRFSRVVGRERGIERARLQRWRDADPRARRAAGNCDEKYFVSGATLAACDSKCEFSDLSRPRADRLSRTWKPRRHDAGHRPEDHGVGERGHPGDVVAFFGVLDLPWRPKRRGGRGRRFDRGTGKVVKHIERWDVDPEGGEAALVPASAPGK